MFLDLSVCTIIPTLRKEVKKNASKVRISGLWAMKGKKQTGGKSYSFPPVPKFTPIKSHENPAVAKSDGANMLKLDLLEGLLTKLVRIRQAIK